MGFWDAVSKIATKVETKLEEPKVVERYNLEEAKLAERYNAVMPRVKRYLDSVGFELPPDENVFFMEIDENTGKWKYETTATFFYFKAYENDGKYFSEYKYELRGTIFKTIERPNAGGILLTPDGKAYIGSPNGAGKFWWCNESLQGIDNSFKPVIQNVLAVGNIKNQLICGYHQIVSELNSNELIGLSEYEVKGGFSYTNDVTGRDLYRFVKFPKTVKNVFVIPKDDFEKKNTVSLGSAFSECTNLRLFYCGFDCCVAEKYLEGHGTYKVFADDSHADFISPSKDCLEFFNEENACKNWNFKVGTTIQNAVSSAEAEKAEADALSEALKADEEAKLAETKAVLEQLEAELAEKKAQVASLGIDAQGIVQKAKLNKEIKELEPQIETLKAEVEKKSK